MWPIACRPFSSLAHVVNKKMQQTHIGKVARIILGLPHFAEVEVSVVDGGPREISVRLGGAGFKGQGSIEDASESYATWIAGARLGVEYALTVAKSAAAICVSRISGMTTDTNPSIVAAAAAEATWSAVNASPPAWARAQLDRLVRSSWSGGFDELPNLVPEE